MQKIKLTESELKKIIANVIKEEFGEPLDSKNDFNQISEAISNIRKARVAICQTSAVKKDNDERLGDVCDLLTDAEQTLNDFYMELQ